MRGLTITLLNNSKLIAIAVVVIILIIATIKIVFGKNREYKKVLDRFEEMEKERGIISNKEIFSAIGDEYKQIIIDNSKKKIFYLTSFKGDISNINIDEFSFKDIAGFEVLQNRRTELLVVGDYVCNFSRDNMEEVFMQGFRILINDIKSHNIEIVVSESADGRCENCMPCIKEWTSRINSIIQGEQN